MKRCIRLDHGNAYIVTDLHGSWDAYQLYRDHFLSLHYQRKADYLIFLGDVIHGYGPPETDQSLQIVLDIMRLRAETKPGTVILLMGNHELPHIYGIGISKGDLLFTPRFEHALGKYRELVIRFFMSLPFWICTAGGTLLMHAGASLSTATDEARAQLAEFSHAALLGEASALLQRADVSDLLASYNLFSEEDYRQAVWENLAVSDSSDPRYHDLLRGFIVGNLEPEWPILWNFFFTQCEAGMGQLMYGKVLERFLAVYSVDCPAQQVMVSGHVVVKGGYQIIGGRNLRLASWAHACPSNEGCYLLFDVAAPVETASDLEPYIHPLPG